MYQSCLNWVLLWDFLCHTHVITFARCSPMNCLPSGPPCPRLPVSGGVPQRWGRARGGGRVRVQVVAHHGPLRLVPSPSPCPQGGFLMGTLLDLNQILTGEWESWLGVFCIRADRSDPRRCDRSPYKRNMGSQFDREFFRIHRIVRKPMIPERTNDFSELRFYFLRYSVA